MDFKKIACTAVRRWNEKRMAGRAKDVPRSVTPQAETTAAMAKTGCGRSRNRHTDPYTLPAARAKRPQDGGSEGCSKRTTFPESRRSRVRPQRLPRRTL